MEKGMLYSYRHIWNVSFPIMLGLLAQNVMHITNTIFLGRVGEIEFGASGLAGIYYFAFFMLGFGFSIGAQIIISRRNGAGRFGEIGNIVIQGALFLQIFALLIFGLSSFFSEHFLPYLVESDEIYAAAHEYLKWRSYGFFFAFFNIMFRAFYVGIARTPVLTYNAIVMSVANVILDYMLIFGNFGMPEMGVAGAGLASVISEFVSVIFFLVYTYKTVDLKKFGFRRMKFNFSIVKSILNISIFTVAQYAISQSTWFIFFLAMENHGARALAVTNIVRTFYMMFFIPMNALSTGANTLVGNTMGANRIDEVIPLIKRIALLSLGIIIFIAIIIAIMPEFWISCIVSAKDPTLVSDTVNALLVLLTALPICSISSVLFSSISGTGNTRVALNLEFVTMFLYISSILLIVIYLQSSVAICWTVEHIYWGSLLILSYLYLRFGNWRAKRV